MNKDNLLSPNFSRKLPRSEVLGNSPTSNHEDIFNIDVNSFIVSEQAPIEEILDSKSLISTSFSDGANIFSDEELCQKLSSLYIQELNCQNVM